eukprot:SAG11_NODE_3365_length_2495_cov_1.544658_1_plen_187_part_00
MEAELEALRRAGAGQPALRWVVRKAAVIGCEENFDGLGGDDAHTVFRVSVESTAQGEPRPVQYELAKRHTDFETLRLALRSAPEVAKAGSGGKQAKLRVKNGGVDANFPAAKVGMRERAKSSKGALTKSASRVRAKATKSGSGEAEAGEAPSLNERGQQLGRWLGEVVQKWSNLAVVKDFLANDGS